MSAQNAQPEALRIADDLKASLIGNNPGLHIENCNKAIDKLRRLQEENDGLRKAYWKMRNSAAEYSNYCEDSASTRRCEREYEEGETIYRAAIARHGGQQ